MIHKISKEFKSNIIDVHGRTGKAWLQKLPDLVSSIALKWNLEILEPFTNLTYAFVTKVKVNEGVAVLKISPPCFRTEREKNWYRLQKNGCARLLRHDVSLGALLLEQLKPGISLKHKVIAGHDDGATEIIAKTILQLSQPIERNKYLFPHVEEFSKDLSLLKGKIPPKLYSATSLKFDELMQEDYQVYLLHGDLHHDNILSHGTGFKAIDPHGYIGPAAFEVGAMIRNPYDAFPTGCSVKEAIERRVSILSDVLPYPQEEIIAWSMIYTLIASSWSLQDHGEVPSEHLEIANILLSLT